ncbi:MAG: DUF3108 domain-containing protein [Rectinemataceae bacterium]
MIHRSSIAPVAAVVATYLAVLVQVASAEVPVPAAASAVPARHERFSYVRAVEGRREQVTVEVSARRDTQGAYLAYSWRSPEEDGDYRLDPATFASSWSDVTTRGPTSVIRRVTNVISDTAVMKPDELVLTSTGPFLERLRTIPFESLPKYRILFQGGPPNAAFTLSVAVVGKERIIVSGVGWDCWKLELGVGGVLGTLFGGMAGKTRYWFSTDRRHVPVRTEGLTGMPGSPMAVMELESYEDFR